MHISEIKSPKTFLQFLTQNVTSLTKKDITNAAGILLLFLLLYCGLYLCVGHPFVPGRHPEGSAWSIMVVWLAAQIGAILAEMINIPAPVGMICAGLFLKNVPSSGVNQGILILGLKPSWSIRIREAALAIIFLRSGLEIDLAIFKRVGWTAVKLLLIPGLVEAFFDGAIAIPIFGMPPAFGFALGFILKAIGPALVIQLMFELQSTGLGVGKEIPKTVVAAASFDDMIAITGYTIFINIAVQGQSNQGWHIARGPLSVVFGIGLGCIAALFCSATKLWNNNYKRTAVLVLCALSMKYFFDLYLFTSGGALAALFLGLVVKELWRRKLPGFLTSKDDEPLENIRVAEKHVRFLWRWIFMPLLFCLLGTLINFGKLTNGTIKKAVGLIFAGLAVRMTTTFCIIFTGPYNWKECIWFAIAWIPKATVQAALASLPLDAVTIAYPVGSPLHAQYRQWGEDALTTAVFEILISGTLGCLLVRWFSPVLLQQELPPATLTKKLPSLQSLDLPGSGLSMMSVGDLTEGGPAPDMVTHYLGLLDQLAGELIKQGQVSEDEDYTEEYGERVRAGVRALSRTLDEEVNVADVNGQDAYRRAVAVVRRRQGLTSSRSLGLIPAGGNDVEVAKPLDHAE